MNISANNTPNNCSVCNAPSAVSVSDITATSANLEWNENNIPNATTWDIEIVVYGSLPTNLPTHNNITSNPFLLTGLTAGTRYQCYIRARCIGMAPSAWETPFVFSTLLPNPTPCGIGMAIPDNSCNGANEFLIEVNTPIGNALGTDVIIDEIRFIIDHPWIADMEIFLTAPSGVQVELSTDNGSSGDHYGDPTDTTCGAYASFVVGECGTPEIEISQTPFIGKYVPENSITNYNDGSDPNGIWLLQICDDAGSDFGTLEFFEIVFTSNVCFQPTDLATNNITDSSVELTWNNNGSCNETIIEYGPTGFTPGNCATSNVTIMTVACPVVQPLIINGLNASTAYDFYIREDCGSGNCSTNSCAASFTTDCLTLPISEAEDFDSQTICAASCGDACPLTGNWMNTSDSDFDWTVGTGSTPSFNTGPDEDVSSTGNYIYLETSGTSCSGGKSAELISNCIAVDANTSGCHMSFHAHIFGTAIGGLLLDVTTDGGASWVNLFSKVGTQGDFWEKHFIDLSNYHNQVVQFRFVGNSGSGFTGDIAIDEINFYGSAAIGTPQNTFYLDADGDGFGNANITMQSCTTVIPSGYVGNDVDCNDQDATINPGADEIHCNGEDENCNGNIDDSIFPPPAVNSALVCEGETTVLTPTFFPNGTYYWFNSPTANTPIATGNSFTTPILNDNTIFYLVDSTTIFPGLRISEIDLGSDDIIEVQNIGEARDYTGWLVVLSNSYTNINSVNSTQWNLGNMTADEIDFRSDDNAAGANYLGSNIVWNAGSYPSFAGWAIIIDDTGSVADALFWGWQSGDISNFDVTVNGFNITSANLPWNGNGVNVSLGCNQGNSISLIGMLESNTANDYVNCNASSIAVQNIGLDLMRVCKSNRTPIEVEVDNVPALVISGNPEPICAGTSFDLSDIRFIDNNNADGITSFHSSTPTTADNFLSSSIVNPTTTTTYYIRSSTAIGCFDELPITVNVNNSMNVGINPIGTINACDGSNKVITGLTLGSGTPPYTYIWNTGATTESINAAPNPQGGLANYEVTITDSNGCFGVASMNINSFTMSASIDNVGPITDCNANDGKIALTPSGTAPFKFDWSGPMTGSAIESTPSYTLTNLEQGSYRVTITDDNGCELVIPQTLLSIGGPAANATLVSTKSVSCINENDGEIDISITGNNAIATWSNGSTTEDITDLAPGSYDVTVSDGQCSSILTNIIIDAPEPLSVDVNSIQLPACVGDDSGAIDIAVVGGAAPYTYLWSNGAITQDVATIAAGDYTVTITDAFNCASTLTAIEVVEPTPLNLSIDAINAISCFEIEDGSIELSISGGAAPYDFNWSNGAATKDVEHLAAADYQVTVTDANGCMIISQPATVESQVKLTSQTNQRTDNLCFGEANGSIKVTIIGGLSPYTYLWNNGSTVEDQSNLIAGSYQYTATDANGCHLISPPFNISQPSALSVTIDNIGHISCSSESNGNIEVSTIGGVPPYTYAWSDGSTTESINNIAVGDYELTVTDGHGCTFITTVVALNDDNAFQSNFNEVQQISCYGAKDGMIDIEVEGGLAPYSYLWNNGQTTEDLNNIEPGEYRVTILDSGGCMDIQNVTIIEPLPLEPEVANLKHVGCVGELDGMIQLSTTGGIAPLTYAWSNGETGSITTNLGVGLYDVTVTDVFGCQALLENIPIVSPDQISVDVVNLEQVICVGGLGGLVDITVIGGVPPYDFQWSNGNDTEDLLNVGADDYSLTITDVNGCQQFIPVVSIFEPQSTINTNEIARENITCSNEANGLVMVNIIGGTPPYQYNWSAGQNNLSSELSDTIFNLGPNIYDVTVTDANGCIHVSPSLTITEPTPIVLTLDNVVHNNCNSINAGQISLSTFGGQPPYTFHWSNGNSNEDQVNLTNGSYSVFVEDALGCTSLTTMIEIEQPGINLDYNINIKKDVTCFQEANGHINVTSFGGVGPYDYQWNSGHSGAILNNLSGGFYFATVTDTNGCQHFIDTIVIQEATEELAIELIGIESNQCMGDAEGMIEINVLGGLPPYVISWNNNENTELITSLPEGIYNATIIDATNCILNTDSYFIDTPDAFHLDMLSVGSPGDSNTGTLEVIVNGGNPPYEYQWDAAANNQTTSKASNLAPGTYQVTITDSNNCFTTYNGSVEFTTNIEDELGINTFELFPNPTTHHVNIQIEFTQNESFELKIVDIMGKIYESINIASSSSYTELIDISDLAQGVYIVELQLSNQKITQKKLVVLK